MSASLPHTPKPEQRLDFLSGRCVYFAPQRAERPSDFRESNESKATSTSLLPVGGRPAGVDRSCPFCEGNEHLTTAESHARRIAGSPANGRGWTARVIANKYPAVSEVYDDAPFGDQAANLDESFPPWQRRRIADGRHEVIIESPNHETDFEQLSLEQLTQVVQIYHERFEQFSEERKWRHISLFKNAGSKAGASLSHVHSQLIASTRIPKILADELASCERYVQEFNTCFFCQLIQNEVLENSRLVMENKHFVSFCPFAARFPYETWIVPKYHNARFELTQVEQMAQLADLLRQVLHGIRRTIGTFPYHLVWHSAPFQPQYETSFHWRLEILPRQGGIAGFELGMGDFINSVLPEVAAHQIRRAIANNRAATT